MMTAPTRRGSMSLTRLARLASLVVVAVLLQTILFPNLRILGVLPEVGLVVAIAIAYFDGPESGASIGFAQGLAVDLFLNTPFGLSALAFGITGYLVGLFSEALVRVPRFAVIPITFAAGMLGGAIFVTVGAIVGQEQLFEWASLRIVTLAAIYDAAIAPLVFWLVRRVVRPPIR